MGAIDELKAGGVMTEEETAALIGRTVMDLKAKSEELALLQAKAQEIGDEYISLGASLRSQPRSVMFDGIDYEATGPLSFRPFRAYLVIGPQELNSLCNSIRRLTRQVAELEDRKKRFGI